MDQYAGSNRLISCARWAQQQICRGGFAAGQTDQGFSTCGPWTPWGLRGASKLPTPEKLETRHNLTKQKTVLSSDSVAVFKLRLKTFIFSQAFSSFSAH